jgi:hypothetical protein
MKTQIKKPAIGRKKRVERIEDTEAADLAALFITKSQSASLRAASKRPLKELQDPGLQQCLDICDVALKNKSIADYEVAYLVNYLKESAIAKKQFRA